MTSGSHRTVASLPLNVPLRVLSREKPVDFLVSAGVYDWLMWHVATTDEFDEWFAEQDEDVQAELIAKVELLKLLGPKLGRPHADTLNGSKHANMKELRADTADRVMRVAFAFDPDRAGILLVAGDKSGASRE